MQMRWLVSNGDEKWQLNMASYSSLFIDHTTNLDLFVKPVIEYFQPRSKLKEAVSIKDINDEYEEITHHAFTAIEISNNYLKEEPALSAKSYLKAQLKTELLNHIETDGYMQTINSLVQDLITSSLDPLPIKAKNFTVDSLLKLLEVDLAFCSERTIHQNQLLLQIIKKHLAHKHKNSLILFYMYPELYLSPKEQINMKEFLYSLSNEMHVFVITSSRFFMANEFDGCNYFNQGEQLFTNSFLDDLEWESPLPFERESLIKSLLTISQNHLDALELNPVVSNFKQADIVTFSSIDLYVIVFIMKRLKLQYILQLNEDRIEKPVLEYALDVYEKM
ncbi:hypothetical protein ACLIBH_00110 [Virgibacillus sp. W0430]|uniref:hypothetical protein n=1 Tax=Virgibacillus sp. W0430 TaxID=3391580 RepID=UPI003F45A932